MWNQTGKRNDRGKNRKGGEVGMDDGGGIVLPALTDLLGQTHEGCGKSGKLTEV